MAALAALACSARSDGPQPTATHPLVPGLRSDDLNDTDWARPFHDRVGSGFSPLTCGITAAPKAWSVIESPGQLRWLTPLTDATQGTRILVNDGRLRLVDLDGRVLWTSTHVAPVLYHGPLRGDHRNYLLLGGRAAIPGSEDSPQGKTTGPQLLLLNVQTGLVEWRHVFHSPQGLVKPAVGDILPEKRGLEAAVFLSHAEEGCLISFPPSGDPEIVWQKQVVIPGEFDEQYDHGCDIKLDLSQPDQPVIWNVRRFRCRGFDARTGEMLSTLSYEIGGAHRRNYGPWNLGTGRDGQPLICVVSNRVQTHVHGIELTRSGNNRLAWQHYYGEVHKESPGVVVQHLAIADSDNDGITEVVYTVRDPKQDLRTFVRVRDAQTGRVEVELPDCWGLAVIPDTGSDGATCVLALEDPGGRMPHQGDLRVYTLEQPNSARLIGTIPNARTWGPLTVTQHGHRELLMRHTDESGRAALVCCDISNGELQETRRTTATSLLSGSLQAELTGEDREPVYLNTSRQGQLQASTWSGEVTWELPLAGRSVLPVSAADWNDDGRAELFVAGPRGAAPGLLNVYSFDAQGNTEPQFETEYLTTTVWSPTIVRGEDGRARLIAPAADSSGNLEIRLVDCTGSESQIGLPIPAAVPNSIVVNAGDFLPGAKPGIAVSVSDNASAQQGVFLLDVEAGRVIWHRDRYRDGAVAMPYTMRGVPVTYDFDGDGADEVVMDLLSYMAFVRGHDGSFAWILPSANIRSDDCLYAGRLYNSFSPVYRSAEDTQAHWLVTAGIGSVGLMKPDPREGHWKHELTYDMPRRLGMIDVDQDGVMEVGYAPAGSSRFLCRDLWTGEIEWELSMPHPIHSPVITADVDNDGKGEFLVDRFCIGTNDQGEGEIRFQLPQPVGYGLIADFDGDGLGEIVCAHPGGVTILKPGSGDPGTN